MVVVFVWLIGTAFSPYVFALLVGMIPFLYLKKHSKKEVLKINIVSSLVALVVIGIIYAIFYFYFDFLNCNLCAHIS